VEISGFVLVDVKKIGQVKSATVAIGLVAKGKLRPKVVCGTGFMFNHRGYVMTAGHVLDMCKLLKAQLLQLKGEATEIVLFRPVFTDKLDFKVIPIKEDRIGGLSNTRPPQGYTMSTNLDVKVACPIEPHSRLPYLAIKKPSKLNLYDEIVMCGYPSGSQSLNFTTDYLSVRLSPTVQFGRIVGVMPIDEAPTPNAIQTDIVATGGSSGSAIVHVETGEVVAIAQQVLIAPVMENDNATPYTAKIGLVYGITNHILFRMSEVAAQYFENGKPIDFDFASTVFHNPSFVKE
jgi:S1-C subfamily serine protease